MQTLITQFSKCPGYNPKSFNMQRTKKKINSHKKTKVEGIKTFSDEGNL